MHSYSGAHAPRNIKDYASSLAYWENATPHAPRHHRRNHDRRFGSYEKDHVGVVRSEMGGQDAIHWRYHGTNVVTYFANGVIRVTGWDSVSTSTFANIFTPDDVDFNMVYGGEYATEYLVKISLTPRTTAHWWDEKAKARYHLMQGSYVELERGSDGVLYAEHTAPFQWRELKQPDARRALRDEGYHDLRCWLNAASQLKSWTRSDHYLEQSIRQVLKNRSLWSMFLTAANFRSDPNPWKVNETPTEKALRLVREAIYKETGCLVTREYAALDNYRDVVQCRRSWQTYNYL